ncbi:MAG: NAD(P)-binding domain-containing protein [Vicinamibacterales bacterium]
MTLAFIGHGHVGAALADGLQRAGHTVTIAARDPGSDSIRALQARNPNIAVTPVAEAVASADVVFLATPFAANQTAVPPLAGALSGKVLVDCTNPVGPGLTHGLGSAESGSQQVQALAPGAHVVKAFSIYGYENFEDNRFPGAAATPAMFYCGADAGAKGIVASLIADLGWEPFDAGGLEQASAPGAHDPALDPGRMHHGPIAPPGLAVLQK